MPKNILTDEDIGYILGVFLGDGWIRKRGIGLASTSLKFVMYFRNCFIKILRKGLIKRKRNSKLPKIRVIKPHGRQKSLLYETTLYSVNLIKLINNLANDFSWLDKASIDTKKAIIRGLFDSEGCIYLNKKPNKYGRKTYKLIFSNTDEKIKDLWISLSREFGFKMSYNSKYDVCLHSFKQIKKFREVFYPNGFLLDKHEEKFNEMMKVIKTTKRGKNA